MFYSERGVARANRGFYDEAMADFTKSINLDLKFVNAYNGRGNTRYIKGFYDQAIADFIKVINLVILAIGKEAPGTLPDSRHSNYCQEGVIGAAPRVGSYQPSRNRQPEQNAYEKLIQ